MQYSIPFLIVDHKSLILSQLYITNKTMSDLLSKQQPPIPQNSVTVYLRHSGSKSFKVQLSPQTSLEQLKNHVASLVGIDSQFQLLFLGGRELRQGKHFKLTERSILHVNDRRELLQQLTISLILHDPQKDNIFRTKFTSIPIQVHHSQRINDFLQGAIPEEKGKVDLKRSRVIQCGRFLKGEKSFGEEKVVDKAEIHIILRNAESTQQKEQQMEKFVKKVLKHSGSNSKEQVFQQTKEDPDVFQQRYQSDILPTLHQDSLCPHNPSNQNSHLRRSLQPETLEKLNLEFPARRTSILLPTKSSERWMREKAKPSQLTPIKLGLKKYKKYDGPLSVRACNCRRKQQKSRGRQSAKSSEQSPGVSALPSKMVKSQAKLKKSMTILA